MNHPVQTVRQTCTCLHRAAIITSIGSVATVGWSSMSDVNPPDEYDPSDSMEDNGIECCAVCDEQLAGEGGTHGPVVTQAGQRYEIFYDTDPGEAPFFCPPCWEQVENERKRRENSTLSEWSK